MGLTRIRENDMQISQFFVNGDIKGAIDYMRDHEEFKDIAAGFDPSAKSFFSWLGVTYYISAETIDTMLSALSSLCADGGSLLLLDPLYLSVLCGFFGGGDMNGIALLCPEWAARSLFGVLLLANGLVFWKRVLPLSTGSLLPDNRGQERL